MRIRTFCKYLDLEEVKDHTLRDCTVVVDGQNFFYNLYEKSGLPSVYGCEGDKYASYLRKFLGIFQRSNIRLVVIFKGGHADINFKFKRLEERSWMTNNWSKEHFFAQPVMMKELYKQILDELDLEYAICEYESKAEAIAFAKKYKCPVVSYDIEYCFSGVPYIPYSTFNERGGQLKCGLFNLSDFLKKYNLNNDKLAIFIALTDENIFEENFFLPFFQTLTLTKGPYKRNIALLKWLGRSTVQSALNKITNYVTKEQFNEKISEAKTFINRTESTGVPTKYIENKQNMEVVELDPNWFKKGVTMGRIAIHYVNLYRNNIYFGAWTIEDEKADDSLLLSIDIITYAFNLLTNFENKSFIFRDKNNENHVISTEKAKIKKPNYEAVSSPFENGWKHVKKMRLFEHFLDESFKGINLEELQKYPEDVQLLIIALVYFSRLKSIDTKDIVCGVIISYVMLGVVFPKLPEHCNEKTNEPTVETTTEKESVTESDCVEANNILRGYFKMTKSESHQIFDEKLIHPFVEFQHCLVQLNNLNNLCGCSYKPTDYSKTFNGTFIYKLMFDANQGKPDNVLDLIRKLLNPAPSVLSCVNGIFECYQRMMCQ